MKIADCSLRNLLPLSLLASPAVSIQKHNSVEEAVGLLVPYLESFTDSLVVAGEKNEPVGIVGGKEIIESIQVNPSRNLFVTKIQNIMSHHVSMTSGTSTVKQLIEEWKKTGRAFSLIPNAIGGYSVISARKMLEIGKSAMTDMILSDLPKKKVLMFKTDSTVNEIINLMLKHHTRRLLLENTNQFVSDRIILEKIATDLKYLQNTNNVLDLPITGFSLEYAKIISKDIKVNELASIMYGMAHPYAVFRDNAISPWDICLALLSDRFEEYG
jgi:CBS domain-containing protein